MDLLTSLFQKALNELDHFFYFLLHKQISFSFGFQLLELLVLTYKVRQQISGLVVLAMWSLALTLARQGRQTAAVARHIRSQRLEIMRYIFAKWILDLARIVRVRSLGELIVLESLFLQRSHRTVRTNREGALLVLSFLNLLQLIFQLLGGLAVCSLLLE